jgi:acetoin utilization protein AcuB
MLIGEYMTPNPLTVGEGMSVTEAADLMKKRKVRRFPVMRDDQLVGIVTDRDLRSAAPSQVISFDAYERQLMPELHNLLSQIKVKDIMSHDLITVSPGQTIVTAANVMLTHRVSGLPVMDEGNKLVGIITEGDVFRALVDLSGANLGKTMFGFRLDDSAGSIKQVADVIRAHDGRLASILTSYAAADPGARRVFIRIRELAPDKMEALKSELQKKFQLLFAVDL